MIRSARGAKGHIIVDADEGCVYFRIYSQYYPEGFKDFNLYHRDLEVQIIDSDAEFYEDASALDHSRDTLGIKGED